MIRAIETRYAGCRFRSRLEARWAVFFNALNIPWVYEPQGYAFAGRAYLPDFLLPQSATWVEVKGHEAALDKPFLTIAGASLPTVRPAPGAERGPRLLILGPIPDVTDLRHDVGWVGLNPPWSGPEIARYGFGNYHKNSRPWWLDYDETERPWLTPTICENEGIYDAKYPYLAARSARFEHREVPA